MPSTSAVDAQPCAISLSTRVVSSMPAPTPPCSRATVSDKQPGVVKLLEILERKARVAIVRGGALGEVGGKQPRLVDSRRCCIHGSMSRAIPI